MKKKKIAIVMPAYNAEKTVEKTYKAIPRGSYDEIILVDDASKDNTIKIAKQLGLNVIAHEKNRGYGANQKTCYTAALKQGADIIVLLHPDFQYDPSFIPRMTEPILLDKADVVYASRMLIKGMAKRGGMPLWKRAGNKALTTFFNIMLGIKLTDAATGYIAYSKKVLESIPFMHNDNGFCFDEQAIIQVAQKKFRITEIPVPSRYEEESSSIDFIKSVKYGISLFHEIFLSKLNQLKLARTKRFR